ncbi:hypothetical protein [uncultured Thermanaerothrix sp.]|uniref:hypothetical protein n=1 Tax=uncultured Thermanaerothrix sp. TaxID=1195149 RepID=UPI002634FD32|nr:hypothetical protein [uncultured Thermanaerothrix sp.]
MVCRIHRPLALAGNGEQGFAIPHGIVKGKNNHATNRLCGEAGHNSGASPDCLLAHLDQLSGEHKNLDTAVGGLTGLGFDARSPMPGPSAFGSLATGR